MTKEQIIKHLENQIDYFVYELKRSIINSAITGHQSQTIWDKFKGFMQNLYYGKGNVNNPNLTKNILGHGLGSASAGNTENTNEQKTENRIIPLHCYRFFKEWHDDLNSSMLLLTEDYQVPEIPNHIKNTQLNKIIDNWAIKFKKAILNTIQLLTGTSVTPSEAPEKPSEAPADEGTKEEKIAKAVSNYQEMRGQIAKFNTAGGNEMPSPYNPKRKIAGINIQNLPYILRYGDPRIDLIKIDQPKYFSELVKLGRIETEKNKYGHIINDEDKKTVLQNCFRLHLEKTKDIPLSPEAIQAKTDAEKVIFDKDVTLQEVIRKIQNYYGQEYHPSKKPTSEKDVPTIEPVKSDSDLGKTDVRTTLDSEKPVPTTEPVKSDSDSEKTDVQTTLDSEKPKEILSSKEKELEIQKRVETFVDVPYFSEKAKTYSDIQKSKDFINEIFNNENYKNKFAELFSETVKDKINFSIAKIPHTFTSSNIKEKLQKIETPEDFYNYTKEILHYALTQSFINKIKEKSQESKRLHVGSKYFEFLNQLSDNNLKYLKDLFMKNIKKEYHSESNLPNNKTFEEIENEIDSKISNKNFQELVNQMIHLFVNLKDTTIITTQDPNIEDLLDAYGSLESSPEATEPEEEPK